jgi:hypothetical protein
MKNRLAIFLGFTLVTTGLSGAWAQDNAKLRAKVSALYDRADHALEAKDLEAFMSLLTDDYQAIFAGSDRKSIQSVLRIRILGFSELRAGHTIYEVSKSGNMIKAISDQILEGRSGNKGWEVLDQSTVVNLLVQQGDSLKFARAAEIDRNRLNNIAGQRYKDDQIGLSFAVPANWSIFPTKWNPAVQGAVFVLAPDFTSAAVLGVVKESSMSGQQAAETDETIGKAMSVPSAYKLIKSGPLRVSGHEGFEIESEFFLPYDRERHRWRVYFNAGGALYPFCFDAMPFTQWDQVKDGFQFILDSVRVAN